VYICTVAIDDGLVPVESEWSTEEKGFENDDRTIAEGKYCQELNSPLKNVEGGLENSLV
jgi:hypothetical protein